MRRRSLVRRLDCDLDLPAAMIQQLWSGEPDELLERATLLQSKDRCSVARLDLEGHTYLAKRHVWGDWRRTTRMLLRTPASRASASLGLHLANQGVATPRPRASLELCLGPFGYRSYFITDFREGTTLFRLIRAGLGSNELLIHLAQQVGAIWQQLVELNISHNDLKPENFVVDEHDTVWLIDLERARLHRNVNKLRERHRVDMQRFFHVRTWRPRPGAADVFRTALLDSPLATWLQKGERNYSTLHDAFSAHELASGLTVVVPTNGKSAGAEQIAATVESARDLADEILIVDREKPCAQHPWILILKPGELITPELAKRLPEHIVARPECAAFRIPIECRANGNRVHKAAVICTTIRAFHRDRCTFSLRNGELMIAVDTGQVDSISEMIHRETFVRTAPTFSVFKKAAA